MFVSDYAFAIRTYKKGLGYTILNKVSDHFYFQIFF